MADNSSQYVVQPGDSLTSIGRKYRVQVRELAAANNLSPRESLASGLAIIIPTGSKRERRRVDSTRQPKQDSKNFFHHTVRRGESLWSISERYNVTVQELFRWNSLKRSRIYPGKRIKIQGQKDSQSDQVKSSRYVSRES